VEPVPVPHDCLDGFAAAIWRRPAAYLDPRIRRGISMLTLAEPAALAAGLRALESDIDSGRRARANSDLSGRPNRSRLRIPCGIPCGTLDGGRRHLASEVRGASEAVPPSGRSSRTARWSDQAPSAQLSCVAEC